MLYDEFLIEKYIILGLEEMNMGVLPQVKKDLHTVLVKGKLRPNHKMKGKSYEVMLKVNEKEEELKCLYSPAPEGI